MQTKMDFSPNEMMIVSAARRLAGVRTVFVGVGLPNLACNLARRTVAPDLQLIYESGVYGARPRRMPLSIGDPTLVSGAISVCSMADLFGLYLQGGRVEVAFLGGAQIDRRGNLNTTVIGPYAAPKVRLPGSGGACEIAVNAKRIFIIMRLLRRAFVEGLDFLTSPGHLAAPGQRGELRLPGGGPRLVVTDKCIFGFDEETDEMLLTHVHPGVKMEDISANMGWTPKVASNLSETAPPTQAELRLLREELQLGGPVAE
jgi:glutaconate CoA-transferase subunit B